MLPKNRGRALASSFVYDRWLVLIVFLLVVVGLLMVASASMVISDRQYNFAFHYFDRQLIYLIVGLILSWCMTRISSEFWARHSLQILVISLLLLIAVLVPHIGKVVNGSRRWINFGFISMQVSEIAKLGALIYLSSYLTHFSLEIKKNWLVFLRPMLLLAFIVLLLLLEPDFGSATVITSVFLALLFIAGVRLWPFSLLFLIVVVGMAALAIFTPYRLARLTTFMHPWSDQFGAGYQLTQSLIAFGRGGLFGVGLGNSMQKLFYLPEAHTDFLFAVLGEELGLVGELAVITLFVLLVMRIFQVARLALRNEHLFNAYFAFGAGLWIGLQAVINIGVNTGLLPTKGLTLPFISYGGSSMLVNCVVIGILLRMYFEEISGTGPRSSTKLTRY